MPMLNVRYKLKDDYFSFTLNIGMWHGYIGYKMKKDEKSLNAFKKPFSYEPPVFDHKK